MQNADKKTKEKLGMTLLPDQNQLAKGFNKSNGKVKVKQLCYLYFQRFVMNQDFLYFVDFSPFLAC